MAKASGPSGGKGASAAHAENGADCPDCQVEHGDHVQVDERGVVVPSRFSGKSATPVEARRPV